MATKCVLLTLGSLRSPRRAGAACSLALLALALTLSSCGRPGAGPPASVSGDFEPVGDMVLPAGNYSLDSLRVNQGVTLTAGGNIVITVAGDASVNGQLLGDCVAIELRGTGGLTVDGLISNVCSNPSSTAGDLKLVFDDGILIGSSVSDAEAVASDGVLTIADSSSENLPLEPVLPTGVIRATQLPAQIAGGGVEVNRPIRGRRGLTTSHRGDVTINNSAVGAPGNAAADLTFTPNCDNSGGVGGNGGAANVVSREGVLTVNGLVRGGDGGDGGSCEADATDRGSAASATGGAGGRGGGIYLGGRGIVFGANARLVLGNGGNGGEATAVGSDGMVACADGFGATAVGGAGGAGGAAGYLIFEPSQIEGAPTVEGGNGGKGGLATAFAGFGEDCDDGDGGEGGDATATGGQGGNGSTQNIWPAAAGSHLIGDGGNAQAQGGDGGDGSDECNPPVQGGDGGAGGDATTTGGLPGMRGVGGGGNRGASFGLGFGAGNGGAGGDGNEPGLGGPPGGRIGVPNPVDEGDFGADGDPCPRGEDPEEPPVTDEPDEETVALADLPAGELGGHTIAVGDLGTVFLFFRGTGDGPDFKEGDVIVILADSGVDVEMDGVDGSVTSFRIVVFGCLEEGMVGLRGVVDGNVVDSNSTRLALEDTASLSLSHEEGFDAVWVEPQVPVCLDEDAIRLGIEN